MAEITIKIAVEDLTAEAVKAAENGKNGRYSGMTDEQLLRTMHNMDNAHDGKADEMAKDAARILKAYCKLCGNECAGCFLQNGNRTGSCMDRVPELWEIAKD